MRFIVTVVVLTLLLPTIAVSSTGEPLARKALAIARRADLKASKALASQRGVGVKGDKGDPGERGTDGLRGMDRFWLVAYSDCSGRGGSQVVNDQPRRAKTFSSGEGPPGQPWFAEPGVGRVADGVPSRVDRLRACGNALVPQIAEWIGRRIVQWEHPTT